MSKIKIFKGWVYLICRASNALVLTTMLLSSGISTFEFIKESNDTYQYLEDDNIYKVSDYRIKATKMQEILLKVHYNENINAYNNLLSNCSDLIKKANFKNPAQCMGAFCYMLNNGYLSYNKTYNYTKNVVKNRTIPRLNGSSIMSGYGNCENNAVFLTELLKKCDYNAYEGSNYFYTSYNAQTRIDALEKYENVSNLDEMITNNIINEKENVFFTDYTSLDMFQSLYTFYCKMTYNNYINHMSTIVIDKNNSYLLDPTNLLVFDLVIDENGDIKINDSYYRENVDLYAGYISGYLGKDDIKNIVESVKKNEDLYTEDYYDDLEIGIKWAIKNKNLLEKFYDDNKNNIDLASTLYNVTKVRCYFERIILFIILISGLSLTELEKYEEKEKFKTLKKR